MNSSKKNRLPFESLGIPEVSGQTIEINKRLYETARASLDNHEHPIIVAWSMWDKSCRVAQWDCLRASWDSLSLWSERAADASLKCLQLTIERPLPTDYALQEDRPFVPYGIMVDDRDKLRSRKWILFFESGLCWALVGNHSGIVESLAGLDLASLPFEPDEAEKRQFMLAIQKHLNNEECEDLLKEITLNENADPLLADLSRALMAAVSHDEPAYGAAFESALRRHLQKGELQPLGDQVPVFPLCGNIVWHLAEQRGFYPSLLPFLQDHLFVIQDAKVTGKHERADRIDAAIPTPVTPADRLAIIDHGYGDAISSYEDVKARFNRGERMQDMAWSMISYSGSVVLNSYLSGEYDTCRTWCKIHCDAAINELLGDWHLKGEIETNDHSESYRFDHGFWRSTLSEGLAWGAVGGYWEGVEKLMQFPDPRMGVPEGGKAFRLYYLGLARWWEDGSDFSGLDEARKQKGAKLLVDQIAAIANKEERELSKAFDRYNSAFLKKLRGSWEFSYDAIFNWNLAKKNGLNPKVASQCRPYLFELPK